MHQNHTVKERVESLSKLLPEARWNEDSVSGNSTKESSLLKLNCEKALHLLGCQSGLSINETLRTQFQEYETIANKKSVSWAM